MADVKYSGVNRGEDTRYKVNNNILRMMNANPTMGLGYLIGNAIGENYFGKKRAKSAQEANDNVMNGIGADEKNGVTGVPGTAGNRGNDYYSSMNKAFDEYRNGSNGRVLYEGRNNNAPRTPQQNNTSGVTVGNVDNGGGVSSVADGWNRMVNGSGYNAGNTTMFTNGTRDLGNVIGADANGVYGVPGVIGADANGVYGIPTGGSAPSAANIPRSPQTAVPNPNPTPIPYTPEQLQQIQAYGGFTPEELRRMGAAELIPRPVQAAPAPSGGGLLSSVANAASNRPTAFIPEEEAAAMDRRTMFVPEEEAGLAEARLVANNLSRAAATPATAADYNGRFITPGHDDSLTLGAIFGGGNQVDPKYAEMAAEWLKDWEANG